MPPTDSSKLRTSLGRKLTKRKADTRTVSMDLQKNQDDADKDVAVAVPTAGRYMHQSIFSMITAAGSTADFQSRFDDASSESDDEESEDMSQTVPALMPASTPPSFQSDSTIPKPDARKHFRQSSTNRLFQSMHKLRLKPIRERKSISSADDLMSTSQILAPRQNPIDQERPKTTRSDAPMMSRILQAEADMQALTQEDLEAGLDGSATTPAQRTEPVSLAQRLMDIFAFAEPEDVISEWPCWLLQSVLVQGFLYVTQHHVCFYAYLPKKATSVAKSGYLSKRGQRNPRYNRYWMQLKGDVLSYYEDTTKIYYPSGQIDLRRGISANLAEHKEKSGKDNTHFTLTTDKREYMFKADTPSSARDWVKHLQKVIFRSHNEGDSVKISLPIDNIMDIEEDCVLDFADTVKIRVIDNDETYAIDEYFFSFFTFGEDATRVLRIMIENNALHKKIDSNTPSDSELADSSPMNSNRPSLTADKQNQSLSVRTPELHESVRATLLPHLPTPRALSQSRLSNDSCRSSLDVRPSTDSRRRSFDVSRPNLDLGRRSVSQCRSRPGDRSPMDQRHQDSQSSPTTESVDPDTSSSAAFQSMDDTDVSASQILNRSDVFQAPTINTPHRSHPEDSPERIQRNSQDTARSSNVRTASQSRKILRKRRSRSVSPAVGAGRAQLQASSSALQSIGHAASYPIQRASTIAGFLRSRSKRMSNLLATESMGYYEKVSGMWAGGSKHYGPLQGMSPSEDVLDDEDMKHNAESAERFREHFALPESEDLKASFFGHLQRVLPLYGKIYIGTKHLCYRSLLPGTRTKLVLPLKAIESVSKEKSYRLGYFGCCVVIRGHEEIFFDFPNHEMRDDCAITIMLSQEMAQKSPQQESGLLTEEEDRAAELAKAEHQALQEARKEEHAEHDVQLPLNISHIVPDSLPVLFDDPRASIINFKPTESLRITCLTIGSRGDVQPYIALCKGLIKDGHKARIATHLEFKDFVEKNGIEFRPVEGDPAELMRICVENGMFTYSFMREASGKFRGWLDGLMMSAWEACQGSDVLIESPSAMIGVHIAEALEIPYFRAFTMPWTRTRAYPHAFAVPEKKLGGNYNYLSYVLFDNVFWKATSGQTNSFRKKVLGLGSTSLSKMQPNKIPFLYNFSPHVVPPPLDYSDWIRVTGYWFLDEDEWKPPAEFEGLKAFIQKARDDGKKLVYVGFGSIIVENPRQLTEAICEAVVLADVRCILAKGWSDRGAKKHPGGSEVSEAPLPPEIHQIKYAVPHSWLFTQVDAAVHHGGAGTTGASLRAGIPTIVKPFFGDQFFFGGRVADLGVGVFLEKLTVDTFRKALKAATTDERIIVKARVLGEEIRAEDGVGTAIQAIYRDMEYAKSLIKRKRTTGPENVDDLGEDFEETWTFIGDESDPELQKAITDWQPTQLHHGVAPGKKRMP